jgi:hypothetical protein
VGSQADRKCHAARAVIAGDDCRGRHVQRPERAILAAQRELEIDHCAERRTGGRAVATLTGSFRQPVQQRGPQGHDAASVGLDQSGGEPARVVKKPERRPLLLPGDPDTQSIQSL